MTNSEPSKLLVLWDVDHTLIENSGVSKETYALTFENLTGRKAENQPKTDGRTDREIMRNLFIANGGEPTAEQEAGIVPALLEASTELVPELLKRGYLLPGIPSAIERLDRSPVVVQAVLTGNLRPNADNKLKLLGDLVRHLDLDVGGYGSDDIVRSNLVAVAQKRASDKYGTDFDASSTVIIGDTPRDVSAAIKGGAKIIAVATGVYSEEDLREAGAHAVLANLADLDVFVKTLNKVGGLSIGA